MRSREYNVVQMYILSIEPELHIWWRLFQKRVVRIKFVCLPFYYI